MRAALLLALLACSPADGPRTVVVANVHPAGYPTARALAWLAEAAAAEPGLAGVALDPQLGGVLGNEKETLEKLRFGALGMVATSVAPLTEFVPEIGVLTLPYLFRDAEHLWRVLGGEVGRDLAAVLEAEGLVPLAWFDAGARSFYNAERPVRRLADLAGLKIRVQRSAIMRDTVAALGATPLAIGFKDVYTNLYTGAIDGAENNLPSYRSERHFEVAKHYTLDRHSMIPDVLLVRGELWRSLAEGEREAVRELAEEASRRQREWWAEYRERARREVEEAGCRIVEVEDPEAFRAAVEAVYREHAAEWERWIGRIRSAASGG